MNLIKYFDFNYYPTAHGCFDADIYVELECITECWVEILAN